MTAAPTRTGPLAYIVVGVLAVALAAVCGIVVFNKKVSDREAEATRIEAHATELEARADGLSSFVDLQADPRLPRPDRRAARTEPLRLGAGAA